MDLRKKETELEIDGTMSIWSVYLNNLKRYVLIFASAIVISSMYNGLLAIDFTPNEGKAISSYLAPNYNLAYNYNARHDRITTETSYLRSLTIKDANGEKVTTDIANSKEELINCLSTNVGTRTTITDPNYALKINNYRMQIEGNTAFIDIDVENTLPVMIKDLNLIVVAHSDEKVYFEVLFNLNGVNIEPSKGYTLSLAKDITGFENKIPAKVNLSLVGGYMR